MGAILRRRRLESRRFRTWNFAARCYSRCGRKGDMGAVTRGIHRLAALGALSLGMLPTALRAQPQAPEWPPITAERLLEPAAGDWLGYRRTYDVTAFSPLKDINRRTV